MPLSNPDMLDSSISNVVALLPNEDKINVLLYAMGCLPADGRYVNRISVLSTTNPHVQDAGR